MLLCSSSSNISLSPFKVYEITVIAQRCSFCGRLADDLDFFFLFCFFYTICGCPEQSFIWLLGSIYLLIQFAAHSNRISVGKMLHFSYGFNKRICGDVFALPGPLFFFLSRDLRCIKTNASLHLLPFIWFFSFFFGKLYLYH